MIFNLTLTNNYIFKFFIYINRHLLKNWISKYIYFIRYNTRKMSYKLKNLLCMVSYRKNISIYLIYINLSIYLWIFKLKIIIMSWCLMSDVKLRITFIIYICILFFWKRSRILDTCFFLFFDFDEWMWIGKIKLGTDLVGTFEFKKEHEIYE